MENFESNELRIANFLDNKMSAAERNAFIQQLDNDHDLREQYMAQLSIRNKDGEVELESVTLGNHAISGTKVFQNKWKGEGADLMFQPADAYVDMMALALKAAGKEKNEVEEIPLYKHYKWIAAASLLLILGLSYFMFTLKNKDSSTTVVFKRAVITNKNIKIGDDTIRKIVSISKQPSIILIDPSFNPKQKPKSKDLVKEKHIITDKDSSLRFIKPMETLANIKIIKVRDSVKTIDSANGNNLLPEIAIKQSLPTISPNETRIAQKDERFNIEDVKQLCQRLPLEKRVRVSVTRFSVTTYTPDQQQQSTTQQNANSNNLLKLFHGNNAPKADAIPPKFGDNMTAMLTDGLQNINCFRVLESQLHKDDLNSEIDAGDSKYSSKKAPKAGKQLGPQIVVTGEVTEFSDKDKSSSIMGISSSKKTIKLGFILKMINPETREVIASHQFRIQSKAGGSSSMLFFNSGSNSDPAVAAVMQDGILQAVRYLSHISDSLNIDVNNIPGSASRDANAINDVDLSLVNATFATFNNLAKIISGIQGYQSMEKSLTGSVGSYTVSFKGGGSKLLDELTNKIGSQYEVIGADANKIELKVK